MNIKYTAIICACLSIMMMMTTMHGMSDLKLLQAVSYDDLGGARALVNQGVDVKFLSEEHGLLHAAINDMYHGTMVWNPGANYNLEMLKLLVENGADVDSVYRHTTPLQWAVVNHNLEAVKFLVEHGANINATTAKNGETALSIAIRRGYKDIADFLQKYKLSRQLVVIKDTKGNRSAGGPDINFKFE